MNYLINAIKAAAAVIFLAAAAFLFLPVHDSGRDLVEIKEGSIGKAAAAKIAESADISVRAPLTVSYAVCSRLYGSAKPGCYRFHRASAYSMMKALCRGRTEVFTVADGMTVSVIADALVRLYHLPPDDPFIKKLISEKTRYEGKLFPAIYPVLTLKPEDLINAMLKKFERIEKEYGFMHDELVIASLVQREAKYPADFRRCAGVIKSRLESGMLLELDSTLQYEIGNQRLTKDILKSVSPYNSYMRKGLPPAPICSPGLDAIKAAMRPEKNTYLYFVARKDGRMYFSKNRHEHFKAVEYYMLGRPNGFRPEDSQR